MVMNNDNSAMAMMAADADGDGDNDERRCHPNHKQAEGARSKNT